MRTNIQKRQNVFTNRTPEKNARHATLRTRGNHQNDSRRQIFLVAKHQ